MNNTPQTRASLRPLGVAFSVALGLSLVAGASSAQAAKAPDAVKLSQADSATRLAAPAARGKWPKIVIVSTSPATPVAGETYTLTFSITQYGGYVDFSNWGCHAQFKSKVVSPGPQTKDGLQASCSWNVPMNAKGMTLYGLIAAKANGTNTYRGWEAPVN